MVPVFTSFRYPSFRGGNSLINLPYSSASAAVEVAFTCAIESRRTELARTAESLFNSSDKNTPHTLSGQALITDDSISTDFMLSLSSAEEIGLQTVIYFDCGVFERIVIIG